MGISIMRNILMGVLALGFLTLLAGVASAQTGDLDRGEVIYELRCLQCHGEDGDGLGPAAERLNPPPRDFTLGEYKYRTSGFDSVMPNDADLMRMIRDGMPGTAMPGWDDMLSEQDMADVMVYIKYFAELEGEPESQVDYGTQVASSPESIAKGAELFQQGSRCSECHGAAGRGDAVKKLKDDNGDRTWPRNLTKPWTFRASNDPKDIFTRISVGIPITQMPSFADPISKKSLGIEDRWHIANYVASLAKTEKTVRPENFVIQAGQVEGQLPSTPDDPLWATAPPSTFYMLPQIVGEERFFTSANDTIRVRALYDNERIALHLEWDDRTKSIPGDAKAIPIADAELFEDAIAVQWPLNIPDGMEKPYFLMGNASKPVNLWRWSSGTSDAGETAVLIDAQGLGAQVARDGGGLEARGSYKDGTWQVVMTRSLKTDTPESDLQFEGGRFVPVAFFAWDGSNSETATSLSMTTWYWILLKPAPSSKPLVYAILAGLLILFVLLWWGGNAARRVKEAKE